MMFGWIIIIAVIYFVFTKNGDTAVFKTKENSAESVLRERFAKGEITEEEYLKMKETLNK